MLKGLRSIASRAANVFGGLERLSKYGTDAWELWERTSGSVAGRSVLPPTRPTQIREYETGVWTHACISVKANVAAGVPWCLKRVVKQGVDEKVTEHEIIKLLERPLPKKTYQNLIQSHVTYLELAGAAFIEKLRKSKTTVPVGLSIMRSDLASPIVSANEGVVGISYSANAKRQVFDVDDVIYHPYFNPANPNAGLAPTAPAWITLQIDRAAREWNWDFFRNGASPDIILSSDEAIPLGEIQRVKSDFEGSNANATGRGRRAHVVPFGWKVTPTSASHREMQFERMLQLTQREIAAVYHVPPVLLGLETQNYATADKQLQVFLWQHVVPLVESILAQYTIELVEEWPDGEELYLAVDREEMKTDEDRAIEAESVRADFAIGLISKTEGRTKRGYAATEGGAPDEREGRDQGVGGDGGTVDAVGDRETEGVGAGSDAGSGAPTETEPVEAGATLTAPTVPTVTLNGAQIASMVTVVQSVAAGTLPRDAAKAIIMLSFQVSDDVAEGVLGAAGKGFTLSAPPAAAGLAPPVKDDTPVAKSARPARSPRDTRPPRTPYQIEMAKAEKSKAIERDAQIAAYKWLTIQRGRVGSWARRKFGVAASEKGANGAGGAGGTNGTAGGNGHVRPPDSDRDDDEDGAAFSMTADRLTLLKADEPAPKKAISEEEILKVLSSPMTDAMRDALTRGVALGGDTQGAALGIKFDLKDPAVMRYLADRETNLEKVLQRDTADMVKKTILSAYADGSSELQIVTRVLESGAFTPGRAQRIARTEVHAAIQSGSHEGMVQAGVEEREWLTSLDDSVRELHEPMNGQVRKVDEPFEDVDGNELMYPGDPNAPPETQVNCRCTTLSRESEATSSELAEALGLAPADGEDANDKIEDKLTEAAESLPSSVIGRLDPEDVEELRYAVGRGRDAEYDIETGTATIGPRARGEDVETVLEQHLAASIMTASDARGLRNQLVTADLVTPDAWDDVGGTEKERAVQVQAAIISGDRDAVGEMLGRELSDVEWKRAEIVGKHFWTVGRTGGKVPRKTNPKREPEEE